MVLIPPLVKEGEHFKVKSIPCSSYSAVQICQDHDRHTYWPPVCAVLDENSDAYGFAQASDGKGLDGMPCMSGTKKVLLCRLTQNKDSLVTKTR